MDDPNPMRLGNGRIVKLDLAPSHQNRATVALIDAAQDLDQGGFPRPVLAKDGVDFSSSEIKVDIVQRPDPRKGLGNPFGRKQVSIVHVSPLLQHRMPIQSLGSRGPLAALETSGDGAPSRL